jgi:hypothetical protein
MIYDKIHQYMGFGHKMGECSKTWDQNSLTSQKGGFEPTKMGLGSYEQ